MTISSSDQEAVPEPVKRRGKRVWLGVVLSPLPMVICLVVADALVAGISTVSIAFALLACLVVWAPLAVSCTLLRLTSWTRLKAHLGVMFVVTFIPMLSVYKFYEFNPDASFSYQINDSGVELIEFSVAGVVIALIAGLINMLCMWIFWLIAVRPSRDLSATD